MKSQSRLVKYIKQFCFLLSGNSVTRKLKADLSDIHHCQGFNLAINSDIKSTSVGQAKCTKPCCHWAGGEQVVTIPAEAVFVMENSSLGEVWWNEISFTARERWWVKEFAELSTNWKLRTPCTVVA